MNRKIKTSLPVICRWIWLLAAIWLPNAFGQTINISSGVQTYASLANATVNMTGSCELRVTGTNNPISGCVINLDSEDAYLMLTGIKPSVVASTYLAQVWINGAAAVADANCRVVQYAMGTVIVPHPSSFQPLTVYSEPNFNGESMALGQYTYYKGSLGSMYANISSFKLKRGYAATLAQNEDGTGISKCYVAQDGDMDISVLPAFNNGVRFVYVVPWRWMSKKGIAGDPGISQLNVNWWYDWNIDQNSARDLEYVPIRAQRWWPDLNQDWQGRGASALLGYNEPDSASQANIAVGDAIWSWPDLLSTGLRVGSPAPTDGGYSSWLYPFIQQADAANLRVDFVAVHYYRCYDPSNPSGAANAMYAALKDIYDNTKRPIWITEWNNGANWTTCTDPTYAQQQACIDAMMNMLESTPWVERYSLYNWVEDVRAVVDTNGVLTPAGVTYRDKQSAIGYVQTLQDNKTRSFAQLSLDSDALDSSGYGNNGITTGCPAYTNGYAGQAMVFDGANTHVTLPPNIATNTAFTFAAWVKWNGGGAWQRIFDFGNSTTHYLFLTPNSGSNLRFAIANGGGEQQVNAAILPQNQWTHVAVTLSGNTAKLYTNGVLAAQNTAMTISPASFMPRYNFLGKSQFPADPGFNGLMDNVLITDTALSATQIAALVTDQSPQFINDVLSTSPGTKGQAYTDTIAGSATDPDAGDTLTYSKAGGPAWLTVASNGALSGTPGLADGGTNSFVVRVSDSAGMSVSATLVIDVNPAGGVAHYQFEGNTLSSVGTANGTLTGPAYYVAGYSGLAIDLNGATNYVTLPAGIACSDEITVAAWVNPDVIVNWARLFDFGSGTGAYMFLAPSSGGGVVRCAIKASSGSPEQQIDGTAPLAAGVWSHVAVTFSGTTGVLYVNGTPVGTNVNMTFKPSSLGSTTQNWIGRSQFAGDPYFTGKVDEFYVYDRALTATEIQALMNNIPPAAPTALAATGGNLVANLGWTQSTSSGITGNNVYRSATGSGGPYNLLANLGATTSYADTAVTGGSTYYYTVTAVNSSGESAMSAYAGATPTNPPPAAPTNLTATSPQRRKITLNWTQSISANITTNNVYRATVSGGPYTKVASVAATTSYANTGLSSGTTYYYVVTAVSSSGLESPDSNQGSATSR